MGIAMFRRGMLSFVFVLSVGIAFARAADSAKLENLKNKNAGVLVREIFVFRNQAYHAKAISRDGTQLGTSDAHMVVNVDVNITLGSCRKP